jgi:hypothetical protein
VNARQNEDMLEKAEGVSLTITCYQYMLIMCTILTYIDIAIIGHNTNRVFGLDRWSSVTLRKMKTWKCKKRKYFVVNTVNRYIGKSIIVRKPITRC